MSDFKKNTPLRSAKCTISIYMLLYSFGCLVYLQGTQEALDKLQANSSSEVRLFCHVIIITCLCISSIHWSNRTARNHMNVTWPCISSIHCRNKTRDHMNIMVSRESSRKVAGICCSVTDFLWKGGGGNTQNIERHLSDEKNSKGRKENA